MRKSGSLQGIACDRRCVIVELSLIRREGFPCGVAQGLESLQSYSRHLRFQQATVYFLTLVADSVTFR